MCSNKQQQQQTILQMFIDYKDKQILFVVSGKIYKTLPTL